MSSTEMISNPIPDNVRIHKLLSMNNDSEFHVCIPRKWKESLQLSGYLKLTKNVDNHSIPIERLSI